MGIRPATDEAMKEAVCNLSCGDIVLVDGNKKPSLPHLCRTIIKGDVSIASIAAASIIAKVARDYYMEELHARYPVYGFAQHKGYGTTFHLQMIKKYGPCPEHRTEWKCFSEVSGVSYGVDLFEKIW